MRFYNNLNIRVFSALVISIVFHIGVMGLNIGGDSSPVAGITRKRVRVQLVARKIITEKPVAKPVKVVRKAKPVTSVVSLPRPVEVVVQELPAVSLPTAPIVPEFIERSEDIPPVQHELANEIAETSTATIILAQPLYRQNPPPEYPARARRRHLQGTVILDVSVNLEGEVDHLEIHEGSGHKILDRAALSAVKGWLFEPGRRGGYAVAMNVLVPVRFSLR